MSLYCSICDREQEPEGIALGLRLFVRAANMQRCHNSRCKGPHRPDDHHFQAERKKFIEWPVCIVCSFRECKWCGEGVQDNVSYMTLKPIPFSRAREDSVVDRNITPPRFAPWASNLLHDWLTARRSAPGKRVFVPRLRAPYCTNCLEVSKVRAFVRVRVIRKDVLHETYFHQVCGLCLRWLDDPVRFEILKQTIGVASGENWLIDIPTPVKSHYVFENCLYLSAQLPISWKDIPDEFDDRGMSYQLALRPLAEMVQPSVAVSIRGWPADKAVRECKRAQYLDVMPRGFTLGGMARAG
jgi:hypothetical protein